MSERELPLGWCLARVSDVVVPVAAIDLSVIAESEFTYVDIGSIDGDKGTVAAPKTLPASEAPSRARQCVHQGDILFSTVRPYLRAIAMTPALNRGVASTGFCVLRAAFGIDARWLFHWVRSDAFLREVLPFQRGSSYPAVREQDVLDRIIRVPPAAQQRRIADALDALFSGIDEAEVELQVASRKLKRYRQSLLKAAVEGDLTAEWRRHNRPQETGAALLERILHERRLRRQEPFDQGSAVIPDGWAMARIEELATVGTGVTPLRSNYRFFQGGDVPWVTSGALNAERVTAPTEYLTKQALRECRLRMYPAGALLIAMYGEGKTRGKCAELAIDATINQAVAALVIEGTAVQCRDYVKAFLWNSYELMRQQASGGVQPNLNLAIIKRLAVPLPPLEEQAAILNMLSAQLEEAHRQEQAIAHGLKMAAAQRQNILRAAFSGQLVPQDPADEPASVLLGRIRASGNDRSAWGKPTRSKPAAVSR